MSEDVPVRADQRGLERVSQFCELGLARTDADAMTVTFVDRLGNFELLHATDEMAEHAAQVQFAIGQGPEIDAASSGLVTMVDDLEARVAAHRWPVFAEQASQAGVRAACVYPVLMERGSLGTVGFYCRRPMRFSSEQHRQALAITELIGLAIIAPDSGESMGSGLRMSVHQAAGMIMIQANLSIQDALVLLRSTAFTEDVRVTDVAADVIAGRRRFEEGTGHGGA